jgi:hypothetical protein
MSCNHPILSYPPIPNFIALALLALVFFVTILSAFRAFWCTHLTAKACQVAIAGHFWDEQNNE